MKYPLGTTPMTFRFKKFCIKTSTLKDMGVGPGTRISDTVEKKTEPATVNKCN